MSCDYSHDDGAYVLGSLSPAERADYQAHLATCDECTRAVQELAGLPGLLGRVSAEVLESPQDVPLPDTLLPSLLREARQSQRRRTRVAFAAAAAAAVVVAGGSLGIGLAVGGDGDTGNSADPAPTETTAPAGQAMEVIGPDVMSASLALTGVSWGTKLDLTCSYPPPPTGWSEEKEWTYAMFVLTRDGKAEQVATWRGLPGKSMRLAAATAANRDDISSVEIRTLTGEPLLRLDA
jgi:hypothetical protein